MIILIKLIEESRIQSGTILNLLSYKQIKE